VDETASQACIIHRLYAPGIRDIKYLAKKTPTL